MELTTVDELTSFTVDHLRPGQKMVYFIRHGQSTANVASNTYDDLYRDAPLTELGHEQARGLQKHVAGWGLQVAIVSPMTRAMQTACLACEKVTTIPLIPWPMCIEIYPDMPECQGRNRDELEQTLELTALERFKDINLDCLSQNWWEKLPPIPSRLDKFREWLAMCPETRIAVVCHWGFIYEMMRSSGNHQQYQLHNCTWLQTIWEPSK